MSGLFGKKTTISNSENRIGALRIQSSSQGVPIPIVYGATRLSSNLLWYGDFTAIPHTETQTQGGKGGGGVTTSNTTYTYTVGVIFGLCEGPIDFGEAGGFIGTIWSGKDITSPDALGLEQFGGTPGQSPWGYLVTNHPEQAIPYAQTAYAAASAFNLGNSDSLPNLSFEVYGGQFVTNVSYCTPDVNPGHILRDLITNNVYGCAISDDVLGLGTTITDFFNYCRAANFLCAPAYKEQRPAADIITELAQIGNSALVWSEGLLKIRPYADSNVSHTPYVPSAGIEPVACVLGDTYTFSPDLTVQYNLTYDDFIAPAGEDPVKVSRKRQADAFNCVQIECLDRTNDYNPYVAEAKDQANIDLYGIRQMPVIQLHAICDKQIARNVAQAILQRTLYVRNTYEFTVGWRYARLEPMDIVSITDPKLGLNELPVRIIQIDEDEDGALRITAEDLSIGVSTPGIYTAQDSGGSVVNSNVDPGNANGPVIFQPPIELSGVPQIWIGASGGDNWGGCEVWVSTDNASYSKMGTLTAPARFGVITANFPAHSDPDTVNTLSVNLSASRGSLTSATTTEADAGSTISYLDGEIIDYSTVTLTSSYNYNLTGYIRRGQNCSISKAHTIGATFMRLDAAVGKFNVDENLVGQTLYVKLVSFNKVGGGLQNIADVSPTTYVIQQVGIVAANGAVPTLINQNQVFCIPSNTQYSVLGRCTDQGRINCEGRMIVT